MNTIDQLVAQIEVEIEQARKRRDRATAERKTILATAQSEGRANLTDEEDREFEKFGQAVEQAKRDIEGAQEKLANATKVQAEEREAQAKANDIKKVEDRGTKPAYDEVARVGAEERTYNKGNDRHGTGFLRDVCRQFTSRDAQAEQRLARHMHEEQVERAQYLTRAVGTGAFSGLTVPQYLTDMYAPATAALRPFADACNTHPLPDDGMAVNISRITTPTKVDLQATENTGVALNDADDTLLTIPVQTAAGQQTVSRQAIDRGTGIESVVFQDLFNRYATTLDNTLLNQAATGLTNVATPTSYTDTTPTGAEFYPKILAAASGVEAALLAMGVPTHAVMHSRRWYWLSSQMSNTWPLINSMGLPVQAAGVNNNEPYGSGIRGVLPNGLKVVVDNNIATNFGAGTNEDEVYVVPEQECHLWEDQDAPLFIRAEQPAAASLGVLLVVYGYFAYTFGRYPGGMQKIGGTGLTTPAF